MVCLPGTWHRVDHDISDHPGLSAKGRQISSRRPNGVPGKPWSRILPAAVTTAAFWIGLGVFAALYLSSSTVSDSNTYGPIGVTFDLVTWFIAMGAVLTLGAVVGAVWQNKRRGLYRVELADPRLPSP
jgi:uncharacterized BrkB/YihY/UPF0761 family membrane protein